METRETGARFRYRVGITLRLIAAKALTWQQGPTGVYGQRLIGLLRELFQDESLAQAAEFLRLLF